MLRLVRSLPTPVEFATVITVAFGGFIYISVQDFISGRTTGADVDAWQYLTDAALIGLVVQEIVLIAIVASVLRMRGWSLDAFDMEMSWRLSVAGVLLFLCNYAIYYASYPVILAISHAVTGGDFGLGVSSALSEEATAAGTLSLSTIILVSTVNPVFEEVLVVGYVMTVIQRRHGRWLAINISTLIRLAYHLYQGPAAIISIIPMGLLFGYYYARTGKLWPLILAHAFMDFIPLYVLLG